MTEFPIHSHGGTPVPFDYQEFYAAVGWAPPAQMAFAMIATMAIWNAPGHRISRERFGAMFQFPMPGGSNAEDYRIPRDGLADVLEAAFWLVEESDGAWVYSKFVQKWAGIPQKRTPIPRRMQNFVRRRDSHNGRLSCEYCGEDCTSNFHFDHLLPMSRGGIHHPDNLCISCPTCNIRKGGMTDEEFFNALETVQRS